MARDLNVVRHGTRLAALSESNAAQRQSNADPLTAPGTMVPGVRGNVIAGTLKGSVSPIRGLRHR
jgi:hypothetical protein